MIPFHLDFYQRKFYFHELFHNEIQTIYFYSLYLKYFENMPYCGHIHFYCYYISVKMYSYTPEIKN